MSNEINTQQMSELNFDVIFANDGTKVVTKFAQKTKGETAQQARRQYAVSEFVRRDLDCGGYDKVDGLSYSDHVGFSDGHVSCMRNMGRIVNYVANDRHGENVTDAAKGKTVSQAVNLETVWNERFPQGEPGRVSFAAACIALSSDSATGDGITITRGGAAVKFHQAFGDIQAAMRLARGPKGESGDDEGNDDEGARQSWQELVAEAARRASEDGASMTEVVALVRNIMEG